MSLKDILEDGIELVDELLDEIIGFFTPGSTGESGVVQATLGENDKSIQPTVEDLFDEGRPTDKELSEIDVALQEKRIDDAVAIIGPKSSLSEEAIRKTIEVLRPTIKGTVVLNDAYQAIDDPYIIGENNTLWTGSDTNSNQFTTISSVEELESEFLRIDRPITEMIVHWTESYQNANLNAGQIHDRHNQLGHDGIVYHYLIRRDGTLQRGRPVEKRSDAVENHEPYSIHVAFVGGYNTDTQDQNFENNTGIRSLNRSQFNTFDEMLRVFYAKYPGGQVLGHNDIDENVEDPGFDVIEYTYNKFNKCVKYDNTFEQPGLSPSELNDY